MKLTKVQKEIVIKIERGEISDVHNFLVEFKLVEEIVPPTEGELEVDNISMRNHWYKIKNLSQTHKYLLEYIRTKTMLIESNLIFIIKEGNINFSYPINDALSDISRLINSMKNDIIVPHTELSLFVKRFKTKGERERFYQLWVPIGVAILTVIISTLANWLIYSNERNVFITNQNAFSDSLKVRVSNYPSQREEKGFILDSIEVNK